MTQKAKKILAIILTLAVVTALALSLGGCGEKSDDKTDASSNNEVAEISITVDIVDNKGETTTLNIKTTETYLADALVDEDIIEYASDGLYTTVNGITADYNVDGSWWCVTKDGTMTTEGMNDLELKDGDKYEITYTK